MSAVLITFFLGSAVGIYFGKATELTVEPQRLKQAYSLFTWQNSVGELCFAITPKYKSTKFAHNPFSKWGAKCGTAQLKNELAILSKDTYVEWTNWWRFPYPQKDVALDIEAFAQSKGIDLQLNPVLDKRVFPDD